MAKVVGCIHRTQWTKGGQPAMWDSGSSAFSTKLRHAARARGLGPSPFKGLRIDGGKRIDSIRQCLSMPNGLWRDYLGREPVRRQHSHARQSRRENPPPSRKQQLSTTLRFHLTFLHRSRLWRSISRHVSIQRSPWMGQPQLSTLSWLVVSW